MFGIAMLMVAAAYTCWFNDKYMAALVLFVGAFIMAGLSHTNEKVDRIANRLAKKETD